MQLLYKYKKLSTPIKASMWIFLANVFQKGIAFITIPLFTYLMSTEEYGEFSVFMAWHGIISVFTSLRLSSGTLNTAMVQYPEQKEEYISAMQGLCTLITIMFIIMFLISKNLLNVIIPFKPYIFILMLLLILFESSMGLWSARQRYDYKYRSLVIYTFLFIVITSAFSLIVVYFSSSKGEARIIAYSLSVILFCTFFYFYNFSKTKFKFFNKKFWGFAIKMNIPLIPHYLSQTLLNSADKILIERFIGESKVGIYSLAYSLSFIFVIINNSINYTFMPWTFKNLKRNNFENIKRISIYLILIVAGINILMMIVAPEVINLLAPIEYKEAMWIMPPLISSVLLMFLYNLFGNIEFYYKESKYIMIASITGALCNIILNIIFIPMYGYFSAAWTTLFSYLIYVIFHFYFMTKTLKKHGNGIAIFNTRWIFWITIIFLIITFSVLVLYNYLVIRYLILVIFIFIIILYRSKIFKILTEIKR